MDSESGYYAWDPRGWGGGGGLDLLSRVTVNFLIVEAGRVSGAGVRRALRRLSVYP